MIPLSEVENPPAYASPNREESGGHPIRCQKVQQDPARCNLRDRSFGVRLIRPAAGLAVHGRINRLIGFRLFRIIGREFKVVLNPREVNALVAQYG